MTEKIRSVVDPRRTEKNSPLRQEMQIPMPFHRCLEKIKFAASTGSRIFRAEKDEREGQQEQERFEKKQGEGCFPNTPAGIDNGFRNGVETQEKGEKQKGP